MHKDQLLAIFNRSLYEWSYASGLTDSNSVESFKESLYMKIILFFVIKSYSLSKEGKKVKYQNDHKYPTIFLQSQCKFFTKILDLRFFNYISNVSEITQYEIQVVDKCTYLNKSSNLAFPFPWR